MVLPIQFPLPHGIQHFPEIRERNLCYVDKTASIHKLVTAPGKPYFLSRPRRFGKSLLCSTLEAVFDGQRELFDGTIGGPALAINSLEWGWKKHPVIHISLGSGSYARLPIETLDENVSRTLDDCSRKYSVPQKGCTTAGRFASVIGALYRHTGQRVVVIVDEYDLPLLDTIDKPDLHKTVKDELGGVYRVLKDSDRYLKFVFITGVTKFAHVSIFSGLNQLTNLTLDPDYADICGFTHEEVMNYFASAIDSVTQKLGVDRNDYIRQLRQFYNGYRFSEEPTTVYNPFSLLNHFRDRGQFDSYWYESGTPSFLLKLFGERKLGFLDLNGGQISHRELKESGIESTAPEPLLVQSGYLTISDYDPRTRTYTLDYPNGEVRNAFANSLANHYFAVSKTPGESLSHNLMKALLGGDPQQALLIMERFLASIPYDMVGSGEKYYHTAVHLTFAILGIECRSEVRTSYGRADSIVETLDNVYCFEFKIDKPVEEAIARIDEKEYLKPYLGKGKKLFKVGVSFDSKKRNIGNSVVVEVPR